MILSDRPMYIFKHNKDKYGDSTDLSKGTI